MRKGTANFKQSTNTPQAWHLGWQNICGAEADIEYWRTQGKAKYQQIPHHLKVPLNQKYPDPMPKKIYSTKYTSDFTKPPVYELPPAGRPSAYFAKALEVDAAAHTLKNEVAAATKGCQS